MQIRFDDFVFDRARRELSKEGELVRLSPKAFALLDALLEAAPAAVSRDDLYRTLWGATFVAEANLPNLVSEIRAALGDRSEAPTYIKTVHRFGYRFIAQTSDAGHVTPAGFFLEWSSELYELGEGVNLIGRAPDAAVRIELAGVSRRHAAIIVDRETARIEDRGSKNGTYVHDQRIDRPVVLAPGDIIRVGSASLTLRSRSGEVTTMTEMSVLSESL